MVSSWGHHRQDRRPAQEVHDLPQLPRRQGEPATVGAQSMCPSREDKPAGKSAEQQVRQR